MAGVPGTSFTIGWFDGALGMITFADEIGAEMGLQLPEVFQSVEVLPVQVFVKSCHSYAPMVGVAALVVPA